MIVIYIANPSISRGLTQKGSNSPPLKEHRKVYRQNTKPRSSCRNPHRSAVAGTRNISDGQHPEGQTIWRPVPQDDSQDVPQELFKQSVVRLNFSKHFCTPQKKFFLLQRHIPFGSSPNAASYSHRILSLPQFPQIYQATSNYCD